MKIKKSYIVGAAIVALLAVFIVMGVTRPDPHAGHDHSHTHSTADPHAGHDHATQPDNLTHKDLTPDKAFLLTDNKDGTYGVTVKGRNGKQIASEKFFSKPAFATMNRDVLEIADRTSENTAAHWAVYCDIQNNRVSQKYQFVLAAMDSHVAYVDHRNGQFHVFVRDFFDESKYFNLYEMTDAVITESGSPKVSYTLNDTTLSVTYSTKKGTKTMDINLFEN